MMGDYAVLTYAAMLDGKSLGEVVPEASAQLQGRRNAWIFIDESTLLPGFCQALVGMNVDEERSFSIDLPLNFSLAKLSGRKLDYTVSLHAINAKQLPQLDDALAEKIEPNTTAEQLVQKVRDRLGGLAEAQFQNAKRQAAVRYLLDKVDCELPAPVVEKEMTGILRDIVRENQVRGISDDEIRKHQSELIGAAQEGAKERVRSNFLLLRVAEREKLEVSEQDVYRYIIEMASRYEIPVNKLMKDLQRREAIGAIREQILIGKALDLLAANVTVREPSSEPAATT
jgi:trigger factor